MAEAPPEPSRRAPAGAALPREAVTRAILGATLEELAENGFGRTAVEAVARRAGVGKAAIYRRWPSKPELVAAAVSGAAVRSDVIPDTGSVRGDVLAFLHSGRALLEHPLGRKIVPDLIAEAVRTPALDEILTQSVGGPRRAAAETLLDRAVARGELSDDVDRELALDIVPAALYWRVSVRRASMPDEDLERLSRAIVAALEAL